MSSAQDALAAIDALKKATFAEMGSGELFRKYKAMSAEELQKSLVSFRKTYEITKGKSDPTKLTATIAVMDKLLPLQRQLERARAQSRAQAHTEEGEARREAHNRPAVPSGGNRAGGFSQSVPAAPDAHKEDAACARGGGGGHGGGGGVINNGGIGGTGSVKNTLSVLTKHRQEQGAQVQGKQWQGPGRKQHEQQQQLHVGPCSLYLATSSTRTLNPLGRYCSPHHQPATHTLNPRFFRYVATYDVASNTFPRP